MEFCLSSAVAFLWERTSSPSPPWAGLPRHLCSGLLWWVGHPLLPQVNPNTLDTTLGPRCALGISALAKVVPPHAVCDEMENRVKFPATQLLVTLFRAARVSHGSAESCQQVPAAGPHLAGVGRIFLKRGTDLSPPMHLCRTFFMWHSGLSFALVSSNRAAASCDYGKCSAAVLLGWDVQYMANVAWNPLYFLSINCWWKCCRIWQEKMGWSEWGFLWRTFVLWCSCRQS